MASSNWTLKNNFNDQQGNMANDFTVLYKFLSFSHVLLISD